MEHFIIIGHQTLASPDEEFVASFSREGSHKYAVKFRRRLPCGDYQAFPPDYYRSRAEAFEAAKEACAK